ncbi:MAG TPA: hypothetical protein VN461_11920 [Vicinamibacteria bacterium]|jgi:hypothetical protein|nr:hypothetical protein [Vicinamibacteria bacterium]
MTLLPQFELNENYATFRPEGPATVAAFVSLVHQAMKACQDRGVTRLLVDARQLSHAPLTAVGFFELGSSLAAAWDPHIRLAMVGRPDQIDRERFGVLVAENRGLRYSVHESEAEALSHLLAKGGAESP